MSLVAEDSRGHRIRAWKPSWKTGRIASFAVWTSISPWPDVFARPAARRLPTTPAAAANCGRATPWYRGRRPHSPPQLSVAAAGAPYFWDGGKSCGKLRCESELPATLAGQIGRRGSTESTSRQPTKGPRCSTRQGPAGRGRLELVRFAVAADGRDGPQAVPELTFQIRVERSLGHRPDSRSVVVHLACSNGKRPTPVPWFTSTTRSFRTTAMGTR